MADVNVALDLVIDNEDRRRTGKVTIDNNGWPVRFGINKKFHKDIDQDGVLDHDVDEAFWDESKMGADEALVYAEGLYKTYYWAKIQGDKIQDQAIANKMMDMAVNEGVVRTVKMAQQVARVWGHAEVTIDGVMGPVTLSAVNATGPTFMLSGLRQEYVEWIETVLKVHPEWEGLRDGWMKRAKA